jgi:hypothetical protein
MWHLTHIPKVAHFYWGGGALSYLRFLSVKSFKKQNPDWQVKIHQPVINSQAPNTWINNIKQDFRDQIKVLDVAVVEHDFDSYGFSNQAHEVHKSDFLRWRLLATEGGVWSDIDIFYIKPMECLEENTPQNFNIDVALCPLKPPHKHTVGFMLAAKDNHFYKYISEVALANYNHDVYQCMGSDLINGRFESFESFGQKFPNNQFVFLNKKSVYAITSKTIDQFYQPNGQDSNKKFNNSQVIGYHWFGGHPWSQDFENNLQPDTIKNYSHFLARTIQENI